MSFTEILPLFELRQEPKVKYEVAGMPTFLFLKDGEILERVLGADKDGLEATLGKHFGVATTTASA